MRRLLPLLAALLCLGGAASVSAAAESPAYIAIGDSLAFGVGASTPVSGGYVARAHDALLKSDRYRERGLELINLSVPGATSADLLLPGGQMERAVREIRERQEEGTPADDNVEIITVNIGGNDVLALARPGSPCLADPLSEDCQAVFQQMLDQLAENLQEALAQLREAAPRAQIVVMDLYSPVSGRGGPLELVADLAIREMNAVTEAVASRPELGARLASVYPLFVGRAERLVADDNLHPNDEGHELMAEVVLAAIEGRAPDLPPEFTNPGAVDGLTRTPLGEGGLQPVSRVEDDSDLALILAIAIPASLLGGAAIAGAYLAARGR